MSFFFQLHFYLFGLIAIVSALVFVTRKSPVAAALWLVQTLFALAALYVMLDAQFIGAIQVLVYAGAIMVVFLFVVMLLNLGHPSEVADVKGTWSRVFAGIAGLLIAGDLVFMVLERADIPRVPESATPAGNVVNVVSQPLFSATGYLLPFEITSVLLLAAIIGAVVLAKRRV